MSETVREALLTASVIGAGALFFWLTYVFYGWETRCAKCRKPRARRSDGFRETGSYEKTKYRTAQAEHRNLWGVTQGYTSYQVPYTVQCVSGHFAYSCRYCRFTWQRNASGEYGRVQASSVSGLSSLFFAAVVSLGLWIGFLQLLPFGTAYASTAPGGRSGAFASTGSQPRAARSSVYFDARCRVRAEPAMDAKVVGSAPAGAKLRVLEVRDDYWYRVRVGGVVGWVGCRPGPVGG